MRLKGASTAGATCHGTPFRAFRLGMLLAGLTTVSGWTQTQPFVINRLAHAVNVESGDPLVIISWTGQAAPFQVQCRASLDDEWQDVDGITYEFSQTNISTGPVALYRVVNFAGTAESADKNAPSWPTELTATAMSFREVSLSWSASTDTGPQASGVKAYNVYRNGFFLKQVPASVTSTSDTSLSPLTTCSYTVSAVDRASNQSEKSSPASATTPGFGGCLFTTSPTNYAVAASGGNGSVSVSADSGCSWTANSSASWITITSGGSGGGNGSVGYSVAPNTGASSRLGTLTIAGHTFTVNQAGASDSTAPTVTLTSPTGGSTVSGTVNLAANAADNVGGSGVARVEFYRDGTVLLGSDTTAPYGLACDTTTLPNGSRSFSCKAYDTAGNSALSPAVTVTVNNTATTASGQLQWADNMVAGFKILPGAVATDRANNPVVAGAFSTSADFGGGVMPSAGALDIFVAKYTPQGEFLWAKTFGNNGDDRAHAVAVDSQDNIIVTGYFQTSVNFGGVTLTANDPYRVGSPDIFVAKFSPSGNLLWLSHFGGTSYDVGKGLAVDANDNVVLASIFSGRAQFENVALSSSVGSSDIALVKLSGATGGVLWAKGWGGSAYDYPNAVAVDQSGDVVVTGNMGGPGNLGGGNTASGGVLVAKYSGVDGGYRWARVTDGVDGNGIAVDSNTGNIFVTGQISGTVDFGAGPVSGGIFLTAYNPSGICLWAKAFGGSGDAGRSVSVDGSGNLAITGNASALLDFKGDYSYLIGGTYYVASFTTTGSFQWAKRPSPNGGVGFGITHDALGHVLTTGTFQGTADFGGISFAAPGVTDGFLVQHTQ